MIVGPSIPMPIASRIPGTPACAISWLQTTCSIGPMPWPPYSFGQVTPASPRLGELALPRAPGGDDLRLVCERVGSTSGPAPLPCAARARRAPWRDARLLGRVVEIHRFSPLADWPVNICQTKATPHTAGGHRRVRHGIGAWR